MEDLGKAQCKENVLIDMREKERIIKTLFSLTILGQYPQGTGRRMLGALLTKEIIQIDK